MIVIYLDHQGGSLVPRSILEKVFPNLYTAKKDKKPKKILGDLKLNDMSQFTNYIETNQQ